MIVSQQFTTQMSYIFSSLFPFQFPYHEKSWTQTQPINNLSVECDLDHCEALGLCQILVVQPFIVAWFEKLEKKRLDVVHW